MAYERWPDAILIYNDYNTFQWNTDQFIDLVRVLRDAGAPIDAYGCQSHDLNGCSASTLKASMTRIQNELKMPMYVTEYDIASQDDSYQKKNYQDHLPLLWEADYCAGVTLWGYIYGKTWTDDGKGYSGIIKNGVERPAMKWLRDYMQTEKARNAKSPFPGMVKEASVYVRPATLRVPLGETTDIEVRARMRTKTIDHVDFYVNDVLQQTLTEAPYVVAYTPANKGKYALKAVVTATDGTEYERCSAFTAYEDLGDRKFTDLAQLADDVPFAIVSEEQGKAFYGSSDQNLGFADYDVAFGSGIVGYYFKLVPLSGNRYLLRLLQMDGKEYNIWGKPGYLNSQPADGWCSFIWGLNNQNGEDIKDGAVWEIDYVDGHGFTLKNVGTGLYLHDAGPAKYAEPAYFTFCTTGAVTGIDAPWADVRHYTSIYTLQGVKVGTTEHWNSLPRGLYIVGGKKVVKQ